jgi:Contractile injection system tube protein
MPSDFPRTPKIQKGALAVYDKDEPGTQPKSIIVFQFNPETLRRTLADRAVQSDKESVGAAKEDLLRVQGPPIETISLTIELDAADQLADPDANALVAENGLHPVLALLELLMYPPSLNAQRIEDQAKQGKVQITAADLPLVLLVWGRSRVVPVAITGFSVSEEAFDINLNPIRAKVDLSLKVLTYMEFGDKSLGRDTFISYQKQKEVLASKSSASPDESGIRNLLPTGQG